MLAIDVVKTTASQNTTKGQMLCVMTQDVPLELSIRQKAGSTVTGLILVWFHRGTRMEMSR